MDDQLPLMDLGFTSEVIPDCQHVCLIFDDEVQRRQIVSAYLAAGLRQGDLVRYFADTTSPADVRDWLAALGIDLAKAEAAGAFSIIPAENAYCPGGRLAPREVVANAEARYAMARQAGYHGSRVAGEMTWALRDIPGADRLLEYESRLNLITDTFPHIGMCQYDARQFDGATLFKVLQVHPYMIARGQIVRNPYYIRPQEFLAALETNM